MAETTDTSATASTSSTGRKSSKSAGAGATASEPAKAKFARAIDEAKAGAAQLGKEAQERADLYREKVTSAGNDWATQAKERTGQAREMAASVANEGKTRASEGLAALGKLVSDNAGMLDEKVGAKYGDYARSVAGTMQDAATKLDAKSLDELGEDAKELVRNSPALAVGMAAVAGFMVARMFKGSSDD